MGDIIHSMLALELIKRKYPNIQIDWIVEECFKTVLDGNPNINNILTVNLQKIKKDKKEIFNQLKILKQYKQNNYDLVIDAQGLLKSSIVAKIVSRGNVAGFNKNSIREKIATIFYKQTVDISYTENTILRNLKVLCEPLNIQTNHEDIINKQPFLFSSSIVENLQKNYNVFIVGSTWESRNYPKEQFVEIANKLEVFTYIAWGNYAEYEKAVWMENRSKSIEALPKINLEQLKDVISKAKLLIGNDTGPTHMAWGCNVPSITLFGPTPTNRVYETNINKVLSSNSTIDHYRLNKNDFSIKEIKVDDIVVLAKSLLSTKV